LTTQTVAEPTVVGGVSSPQITDISTLSSHQLLALLHRTLWYEGYNDRIAGHITMRHGDETFLCTPLGLAWDEVTASDVVTIDAQGSVVAGHWPVSPAITLHTVVHAERPDVEVAVHHHPEWGTVWSAAHRIPPIYDQLAGFMEDDLVLYNEYEAGVNVFEIAQRNVRAMGTGSQALLGNHGVLIFGSSVSDVHLRCVVLEHRCRLAWRVEAIGGGVPMLTKAASDLAGRMEQRKGWPYFFESALRREIRRDPLVLK
jgi:L-fuculose-phosphate aldolase